MRNEHALSQIPPRESLDEPAARRVSHAEERLLAEGVPLCGAEVDEIDISGAKSRAAPVASLAAQRDRRSRTGLATRPPCYDHP